MSPLVPTHTSPAQHLLAAADDLCVGLAPLHFAAPVHTVYNPLRYAHKPHAAYVRKFASSGIDVLFLGINPGPYGMAQIGVPFGEIAAVRDWMGISEPVERPDPEHLKRPITGFACTRSEVSGRRLWGLFQERYPEPTAFFARHYVANYCPLVFMDAGGANLTPDKLPANERAALETLCDLYLVATVKALQPTWVIGVGAFAKKRAAEALHQAGLNNVRIGTILHPSPASPAANRGWAPQATKQLIALGIWT